MNNQNYKSIDELILHLSGKGIDVSNLQKQKLINDGYFHGYKAYRFFKSFAQILPIISYNEIESTIEYDTKLKSLLYDKVMFIETALKNNTLIVIMSEIQSSSLHDMYEYAISSYKNAPQGTSEQDKKEFQSNKLKLQVTIQKAISTAYYYKIPKISHFYNGTKYADIPLWAVFEILTMGDFGNLLSCLKFDIRDKISKELGINLSSDTNREVLFKYVFLLKGLRNAIAHNDVIYDTRFRDAKPSKSMEQCVISEFNIHYISFATIGDYVILISYFLKHLNVSKAEIEQFIDKFIAITQNYIKSISSGISKITIKQDLFPRLNIVKKHL